MYRLFPSLLLSLLLTLNLYANTENNETGRKQVNFSMVISGGVSLGAYEAGYNWAIIKMLTKVKQDSKLVEPNLKSVAGASAGSINALLSAMYWCQKDTVPLHNSIDDNLFYETWVNLGIEDLAIQGSHPHNKSSLFSRRGLREKGKKIIEHLKKPIFKSGCEVPLGVAVTKVTPIIENVHGIKIKNQNFSVPLTFKEKNGKGIVVNKTLPPSGDFYLSIPDIDKDREKIVNLLFASGAFPGAFQQVKLDYKYKGKRHSNYFIDGGLYDNVPLDLAIALDKNATTFFFMDPSNMRKEKVKKNIDEKEEMPLGFIGTNLLPVFSSFDIMQSMKLYEAINKNFRGDTDKKLVLSSRYHPITGQYLGHFGAFLDQNFREYDYHVGVYDAIYHIAAAFKRTYPNKFKELTQIDLMDYLKNILNINHNKDALTAYNLFLNTEFHHSKPKITDRYSTIYNAFNLTKSDNMRYDNDEFKAFLSKLDMRYLKSPKKGFLRYAKKDIDNWYKRPLRFIVNRITSIENDRADVYPDHAPIATLVDVSAWAGSTFLKEKNGLQFFPLDVPQDPEKENFRTALNFIPGEIATDLNNGGMSLGYTALYYEKMGYLDGLEAKASYIIADKISNFVRVDFNGFKEYSDFMKFGGGVSFFGEMKGSFYNRDSAYGLNTYVDIVDIFRLSYVYRPGDNVDHNYLYFGIENIPSLIYWLNR
jgi:predicted acylesterase/phospholipase RssA